MLRKGTTDFKVFDEIFVERAYAPCVAALPRNLGRVALIDLGANIGLSALYIAYELGAGRWKSTRSSRWNPTRIISGCSPRTFEEAG